MKRKGWNEHRKKKHVVIRMCVSVCVCVRGREFQYDEMQIK